MSFCNVFNLASSSLMKCTLQHKIIVDGISVVCSILFRDVKQNIMCGRIYAICMAMTDGKVIIVLCFLSYLGIADGEGMTAKQR